MEGNGKPARAYFLDSDRNDENVTHYKIVNARFFEKLRKNRETLTTSKKQPNMNIYIYKYMNITNMACSERAQ